MAKPKRKSPKKRKRWNKSSMVEAVRMVREKKCGYKKAAKMFDVPRGTLERYVKSNEVPEKLVNVSLGRKTVLGEVLEAELVQYCLTMDQKFYGLRKSDLRGMAFQLVKRNGIASPFNEETSAAGLKWMRAFLKRHPELSVRSPQSMSKARIEGFNRETVDMFFDLYEQEYSKFVAAPHHIYNVDETGVTIVPHKRQLVISERGKSNVNVFSSAERGKLITIVMCMGATGNYIPPMFIWPRVNNKVELMDGAPAGSISACTKSGWISPEAFTQWFRHFISYTRLTEEDPVLLVLDGHYTHIRNSELIELARANHVPIIYLPPHSTHKMQPLDVGFMKPFKTYIAQELETWCRDNVPRMVNEYVFANIFHKAYARAATMETSVNAFRACGLVPCNRHIFHDHDFQVEVVNPQNVALVEPNSESVECPDSEIVDSPDDVEPVANENNPTPPDNKFTNNVTKNTSTPSENDRSMESSSTKALVLPSDIVPVPQLTTKPSISKKDGRAAVVTSSSYSKVLQLQAEAKEIREELAALKKRKKEEKAALKKVQTKAKDARQVKKQLFKNAKGEEAGTSKSRKATSKKTVKRKLNFPSEDEDSSLSDNSLVKLQTDSDCDDPDTDCLFCGSKFSDDGSGEQWVQCLQCKRWAHELCGAEDANFTCPMCTKQTRNGFYIM